MVPVAATVEDNGGDPLGLGPLAQELPRGVGLLHAGVLAFGLVVFQVGRKGGKAQQGTGGAVRAVLDAAGVRDVLTKSLGTNNPINVARATMDGLRQLVTREQVARERGCTVESLGVRRG